jgi:hypothetical protein
MSGFNAAIVQQVAASTEFTTKARECDSDTAKEFSLAAKNCAQAALALVQAKKTHEMDGRR